MSHSRARASSRARFTGGQSASATAGRSTATTSAPRRSSSKAQKPSKVPTSSARRPLQPGREHARGQAAEVDAAGRDDSPRRARACGTRRDWRRPPRWARAPGQRNRGRSGRARRRMLAHGRDQPHPSRGLQGLRHPRHPRRRPRRRRRPAGGPRLRPRPREPRRQGRGELARGAGARHAADGPGDGRPAARGAGGGGRPRGRRGQVGTEMLYGWWARGGSTAARW